MAKNKFLIFIFISTSRADSIGAMPFFKITLQKQKTLAFCARTQGNRGTVGQQLHHLVIPGGAAERDLYIGTAARGRHEIAKNPHIVNIKNSQRLLFWCSY